MNLLRRLIHRTQTPVPTQEAVGRVVPPSASTPAPTGAAVLQFPPRQEPLAASAPMPIEEGFALQGAGLRPQVLFEAAEIRDFLGQEHFRAGRQQGALLGDAGARAAGRAALIAEFQLTLQRLVERKRAKSDQLEQLDLQASSLEGSLRQEITLALGHLRRDRERLQVQIGLAPRGEGWIERALAQYDLGFMQGLRTRMNFCLDKF